MLILTKAAVTSFSKATLDDSGNHLKPGVDQYTLRCSDRNKQRIRVACCIMNELNYFILFFFPHNFGQIFFKYWKMPKPIITGTLYCAPNQELLNIAYDNLIKLLKIDVWRYISDDINISSNVNQPTMFVKFTSHFQSSLVWNELPNPKCFVSNGSTLISHFLADYKNVRLFDLQWMFSMRKITKIKKNCLETTKMTLLEKLLR